MRIQISLFFSVLSLILISCEKENKDLINNLTEPEENQATSNEEPEIEGFIYRGMNDIYLYKDQVPSLANNFFTSEEEKYQFLNNYNSPEALFDALISSEDRFSYMTDDYNALEGHRNGERSSTAGMEFGLGRISNSNNVFGFIRYIVPGTSAAAEDLERGMIFTEVNGQKLSMDNYTTLLNADNLSINVGTVQDGRIVLTEQTAELSRSPYTENPVHISKILNVEGQKVAYLMYNAFTANFDDELNAAFAGFKSAGITELVLDLRYNNGGSVISAVDLASMITGQFEGEIFLKRIMNKDYQDSFESNNPEELLYRFDAKLRSGAAINSLNLNRVYVLTTNRTASASELIINGLEPYIEVVQIGETTTGKFEGSVTLYDSPNFSKNNINRNHTYALQPLVFKGANANGKTDYSDGLPPRVEISENLENMGELGDPAEPLLEAALNHMLGKAQKQASPAERKAAERFKTIGESGMNEPGFQRMYIDELPSLKE